MGEHLNSDGLFQSDKYPGCPAGKVPVSTKDRYAQDLLWELAQRYIDPIPASESGPEIVDPERVAFGTDLQTALKNAGFVPPDFSHLKVDLDIGAEPHRDGDAFTTSVWFRATGVPAMFARMLTRIARYGVRAVAEGESHG